MRILALDLSTTTGWALGAAGKKPQFGVKRLRPPKLLDADNQPVKGYDAAEHCAGTLGSWLRDIFFLQTTRPDLVVYEAAIMPFPKRDDRDYGIQRSIESIVLPFLLIGAIRALSRCYDAQCVRVPSQTWRKHFLGRSNFGGRDETKRQTVDRCHMLGYMPNYETDDNMADAIGIFDWASNLYGRPRLANFSLFDGGQMKHGG